MLTYFNPVKFIFIFLITISGHSYSQSLDYNVLAKQLKKEYKDNEYASLLSTTDIEIVEDRKAHKPMIIKKDKFKLISLKDYASFIYHAHYDDYSEVDPNYSALDAKKRMIYGVDKVCGNYEMDDIFYSDDKVCSFRVPLKEFANTSEFSVTTKYHDVKYLTKLFFHQSFPAEEKTITFSVPNWMEVNILEINFEGFTIEKNKEDDLKNKSTKYTYSLKKVKPFDSEDHTKSISYRYPHLLLLYNSYSIDKQKVTILSSPNDLYSLCYGFSQSVDNQSDQLKAQVESLINGKNSQEEKIESIYYWVQDNIRYIAFEQGIAAYKPESAAKVYTNRYGDCKGMANLTKEMLRLAGFDARLTWIGTNDIPYSTDIPSLAIYNHMICTVFLGEKKYYLDATEKFVALDDYAERIQGKEVMIENGNSFIPAKIPSYGKERNLTSTITNLSLDGNSLIGNAEMIFNGESKKNLLYGADRISTSDKDKLFKYLTSYGGDKNLAVDNIKTSSLEDREGSLDIKYSFRLDNHASSFNDELYIDVDPYKQYKELQFDSTRKYDYVFGRKINLKDTYKFKIPEGYVLKYLPSGIESKQDQFFVKISYEQVKDEVIVHKEIGFDLGYISKDQFTSWNNVHKKLVKTYNEQIVLLKK